MTERVETVRVIANVTNYVANMELASQKTLKLSATNVARLAAQRQAYTELGHSALAVGTIAAVGVGLAIARFAEFDQAMSQVQAVTQATSSDMDVLRDAALEAGGRTVFTATEAAHAIEELGKNGLTTAEILGGGLSSALDIAASGNIDVARAAEIAAITMKQFRLEGEDLPHVADLLAAGAGKAAGDVEDLAQALNQSALVARQTGFSIEETTGVLSAFADAGLIGSDAGTSFKTMLQRLTPVSGEAKREMDRLGISAYDAQGSFIGAAAFAGNLRAKLSNLTAEQRNAALAQIFGTDAVRAATVFYEQGANGISNYIKQTNDSGYAARVAADRLNNLRGDVEKLGGALDSSLIQQGSAANDTLRGLVQGATFLVDATGDAPAVAVNIGLVTAAIALSGGAALTAVPKYAAFRANLTAAKIDGRAAAVGIGTMTAALTAATLIVGYFVARAADMSAMTDSLRESLDETTGSLTKYSRELVVKKLAESGAFEAAREAGVSQRDLTEAVLEGGDALDSIQSKLTANNTVLTFFTGVGIRAGNASQAIRDLRTSIVDSQSDFDDMAAANREGAAASDGNRSAIALMSAAADTASEDISALADIIRGFADATLSTRDAQRSFQAAVDEAAASLAQNGATLDINTEAGRQNEAALDAIAKSAKEAAAARFEETQSQGAATQAIQEGRDALINQLADFGITGQAAQDYADRLGLIPELVATKLEMNTTGAQQQLDKFFILNNGRVIRASFVMNGTSRTPGFAEGGYTGSIGRAKIAGFVHGEEFVSTARTTANPYNRAALEYMHRGGVIRGYADGGYVRGVGSSSAGTAVSRAAVGEGDTINFNGPVGYDPASVAREIQREKRKALALADLRRVTVA